MKMFARIVLCVVIIPGFLLLLSSCGSGGSDTIIIDAGSNLSSVVPLYDKNGANWNDYVKDDGADIFNATDAACDPAIDTACLHGGQIMSMEVPGKSICDGLTAEGRFSVFEWTCDNSVNPVRFISTGFKPDQGLSDLIDFNTSAFRENYLLVWESDSIVAASIPAIWWANPIFTNNDGSDGLDMNAGEIHIITKNANATYTIDDDRVALLVKPEVVLTGSVAVNEIVVSISNHNFIWVEGTIDAAGDYHAISFYSTGFSAITKVTAMNATYHGVSLYSSNNNMLSNITVNSSTRDGVSLYSATNNTLNNIATSNNGYNGVYLGLSSDNMLSNITANSNTRNGVYLYSSSNNLLSNITANSNTRSGINLGSSTYNTLNNITASSNNGSGISLGSSNNTLSNMTANSNNGFGFYLGASSDNTLSNMTASRNGSSGVFLDDSTNNTLSNMTACNNGIDGLIFRFSMNNTVSNMTASSNGSIGVRLYSSSDNTLDNITTSSNNYGVYLDSSSDNRFTGELQVGTNTNSDCFVIGGTNPGLVGGTCDNQGAVSDAVLTTGVSVASSFVNPAGDDYSLLATDTIIRDRLTLTTGTDTLTHTWSDNSFTTMPRNSVEIQDDGIGNDNLLCESDETCLYTPNIAAYQGHGALVSAGTFSDGTIITGVTLVQYETNGY